MSMFKRVRTTQPQQIVALTPYWAAKRPLIVVNGATRFFNVVSGRVAAFGASTLSESGPAGIGYRSNLEGSDARIDVGAFSLGGTDPITVFALTSERVTGGDAPISKGAEVVLRGSAAETGVEFILNSFSTNDRVTALADPATYNQPTFMAGTFGQSGKLRAYANKSMAEVTPTGTYLNAAETTYMVGSGAGLGSTLTNTTVVLAGVFNSEFSPAEIASLVDNPWQLFAPERYSIYVELPSELVVPAEVFAFDSGSFSFDAFHAETGEVQPGLLVKYWSGSAWVVGALKYWNGSAWTVKPLKRWNGSAWV